MFENREDAALKLAEKLMKYKNSVVLGIPRGGIVLAKTIAKKLNAEFDIVIVRKLRFPYNSEVAIGALSENGKVILDNEFVKKYMISQSHIDSEIIYQKKVIEERVKMYRSVKPKVPLRNRIVIITDDGAATGSTMRAAIDTVKTEKPKKIIVAVPVAPPEVVQELKKDAEVVCLITPESFEAVGEYYKSFPQVSDEEVIELLKN